MTESQIRYYNKIIEWWEGEEHFDETLDVKWAYAEGYLNALITNKWILIDDLMAITSELIKVIISQ